MIDIFFIGDTHFGHANIVRFEKNARPFASIEEHDETLIKNWNSVVRKCDIVWVLGDFAFGARNVAKAGRLNGEKKLVMGNHDHYPTEDYMKHFIKLYGAVPYKHALLTHIPCHPDQSQRWSYNIHGHTHSYIMPDDRYINVSAEQINYTPVSWDELKKKMLLRAHSGNDGVPPPRIGCGKNSADTPVKQAAILYNEEIWTLPRPARHHNIIWAMNDVKHGRSRSGQPLIIPAKGIQGFIDQAGNFLERKAAAIRAEQSGQLKKPLDAPPNLFSEDLW